MNVMHAINGRRSIRNYTAAPVEQNIIDRLLHSAIQAPSAMNSQPWAFAVLEGTEVLKSYSDQAKKYLLSNAAQYPPTFKKYRVILNKPDFNIFYNAPALLIICAKMNSPYSAEATSLAVQNIMLTAYSLGLGTCWIGFAVDLFNSANIKQELNIPENYQVVAPVTIGYPKKNPPAVIKKDPKIFYWKNQHLNLN